MIEILQTGLKFFFFLSDFCRVMFHSQPLFNKAETRKSCLAFEAPTMWFKFLIAPASHIGWLPSGKLT